MLASQVNYTRHTHVYINTLPACISSNTYFSTGKPHLRLYDPLQSANKSILDLKKIKRYFGLQIDKRRFFKIHSNIKKKKKTFFLMNYLGFTLLTEKSLEKLHCFLFLLSLDFKTTIA